MCAFYVFIYQLKINFKKGIKINKGWSMLQGPSMDEALGLNPSIAKKKKKKKERKGGRKKRKERNVCFK
jgi:hypothetical protein